MLTERPHTRVPSADTVLRGIEDLARIPDYDTELKTIILEVRDELKTFLPIRLDEVGLKYYLRLRLLMLSTTCACGS